MVPRYDLCYFQELYRKFLRRTSTSRPQSIKRKEKELFGVSSLVSYSIWEAIYPRLSDSSKPEHLLWALLFLKNYSSERTHSILAGCDPKTFRKWSWEFVSHISELTTVCAVTFHHFLRSNLI